jgi:hypothetical protein
VRYLGEIDATEAATHQFVAKLPVKYDDVTFCYKAGSTGSSSTDRPLGDPRGSKGLYRRSEWRTRHAV